jgi:hypothetical protein
MKVILYKLKNKSIQKVPRFMSVQIKKKITLHWKDKITLVLPKNTFININLLYDTKTKYIITWNNFKNLKH